MNEDLVGHRLTHFELIARLGRGGMGEVYLATDTRLGREVAIKVLPPELAHLPDFRARLKREAQAVSRLNHPHICTLHDFGTDGDVVFLVMERVDGEPLDMRLRKGPLPRDEALRLAVEIASALGAAHDRGVVHRDLKPGNVMLTADGAKLLDFGLAKALSSDTSFPDPVLETTLATTITAEGFVLGTPQYMAPEQIAGQKADPRTDIFAFGALLYEMLSGVRAFVGEDRQELAGAILRQDPRPLGELIADLPPGLERLVKRCLAKEPGARWQCAADLVHELRWIGSGDSKRRGTEARVLIPARRRFLAAGLSVMIAGAVGLFAGWQLGHRNPSPAGDTPSLATRLSIVLPPSAPFLPATRSALTISPDGRQIVYVGGDITDKRLYLRSLDDDEVQALDGTEGGVSPFFSADGQRIGFFTRYSIRYVAAAGGPAQDISFAPPVARGAAWFSDGDVLLAPTKATPLWRLSFESEDTLRQVTVVDSSIGGGHSWPSLLDHDRKALVTVIGPADTTFDQADIVAIDLASGSQRVVVEGGSQGRYLPTGHMVFVRNGSLFAAPFDAGIMRLTAPPVMVIDGILTNPTSGTGYVAISPSGTLVYARGGTVSQRSDLAWIDRSGKETSISSMPRSILTPRLSPDGNRVLVSIESASDDLWILDLVRGTHRRLTFGGRNTMPIWTPDGTGVTYSSVRRGGPKVYTVSADGSGHEQILARGGFFPASWSPDGTVLALTYFGESDADVYRVSPGGSPQPLLASRFNETSAAISPDGEWVAYCSDESGQWEVYATSFPEPGQRVQVSTGGGTQPVWARQGLELYYRTGDRLMAVLFDTTPYFKARAPFEVIRQLPPTVDATVPGTPLYDVALDGQRALVVREQPMARFDRLEVVLDWFRELQQRVPIPD